MATDKQPNFIRFQQMHIDAARNSTDDFNFFHDKNKWEKIRENPFGGPIVLGFQLACLIEYQINLHRQRHDEHSLIDDYKLQYSNYQFSFARALKPDEAVTVHIKNSRLRTGDQPALSNRIFIKSEDDLILMGTKKETTAPLCKLDWSHTVPGELIHHSDRDYIAQTPYFLKRKFMNTGNAKNFLTGSNAEQSLYIDELENKVCFPETFPISLLSCALLERAHKEQHDFHTNPMVYTAHFFSIDRATLRKVKSNDTLHILIKNPTQVDQLKGLGNSTVNQIQYECVGIINDKALLYQAQIWLAPLAEIIRATTN
jgi:hypothetical protein